MGIKLGDISPLAGVLSGEGMMGKAAQSGMLGLAPMFIAKDAAKDQAEKEAAAKAAAAAAEQEQAEKVAMARGASEKESGMKKGGKVSAQRGDGIAKKGRTKGRFV